LASAWSACARTCAAGSFTFCRRYGRGGYRRLAFVTRYCFTSRLFCGSQSSLYCPPPPPATPTILQYYCTPIAQYTTPHPSPLVYTIHHTTLAMAVSCEGHYGRGGGYRRVWKRIPEGGTRSLPARGRPGRRFELRKALFPVEDTGGGGIEG